MRQPRRRRWERRSNRGRPQQTLTADPPCARSTRLPKRCSCSRVPCMRVNVGDRTHRATNAACHYERSRANGRGNAEGGLEQGARTQACCAARLSTDHRHAYQHNTRMRVSKLTVIHYPRERPTHLEQSAAGPRGRMETTSLLVPDSLWPHRRTEPGHSPAVYDVYCMLCSYDQVSAACVRSAPSERVSLTSPAISYLLLRVRAPTAHGMALA